MATDIKTAYADLERKLEQCASELHESVKQQAATAEILRVIGSASSDVTPVLEAVARSAAQLCESEDGRIFVSDGGMLKYAAGFGRVPFTEFAHARRITRGLVMGRAVIDRAVVHVEDLAAVSEKEFPEARESQRRHGHRTTLAVPLLWKDTVFGVILLRRLEVRPFSAKQIELVKTFADQSAIAIENVRLFNEIQQQSRQLQVASRHKSEFLANMSHELRTPLNAIIGITEMLQEDARDLKRDDELDPLERIARAARHLLALINDILDLSKIEAGKMEIHLESFSIAGIIEDVVNTITPLAAKNGNRVVVECPPDIGMISADQTRLRQALLNLASNAAKFTERGLVTIRAHRATAAGRDWLTMDVTDTGIGVSREQIGRLFQDFVQADASTTRKYGGTGLGLAISRRFCQMMGGDITVVSEPGRGSTFTVYLPTDGAVARRAAPADVSSA
jgi:signal transduction histidine kinase